MKKTLSRERGGVARHRAAGGKRRGSTRPPAWNGARASPPERAARDP